MHQTGNARPASQAISQCYQRSCLFLRQMHSASRHTSWQVAYPVRIANVDLLRFFHRRCQPQGLEGYVGCGYFHRATRSHTESWNYPARFPPVPASLQVFQAGKRTVGCAIH